MTRTPALSTVLLGLGVVLLVTPALFPIQPVLYHDSRRGTVDNRSVIEERGFEIVAYENLSERGQELYVLTLENDGRYSVPLDEGAPDFAYPTDGDLGEFRDYDDRRALEHVVIERPPDADLPPPDEQVEAAEHIRERAIERGSEDPPSLEEARRQIARFDMMRTRTDNPPLDEPKSLARLVSAILGVVAIATGGYQRSRP